MKNNKKMMALLLAIVLVIGCAIGGTIAYLQDKTTPVVNTFSPSNIGLTLVETTNTYKMVPGVDIPKDPKVTVTADIACYVFVKVDAANGVKLEGKATAADYITYAIAEGWELVPGQTDVYYQTVAANQTFEDIAVLANNEVHVLDTVTKEMMVTAQTTVPTLTFTAYAFQQANGDKTFTAAEAWALVTK